MGGKKILIVMGSPRREGNSATLAKQVAAGAEAAGAEVESFYLHDMDIQPCTACDACREEMDRDCVIDDEMETLYPKVRHSDAMVIASPIYWFSVSAQTKLFMDRWYAFGGPQEEYAALAGKRIGLVLTYADLDARGGRQRAAARMGCPSDYYQRPIEHLAALCYTVSISPQGASLGTPDREMEYALYQLNLAKGATGLFAHDLDDDGPGSVAIVKVDKDDLLPGAQGQAAVDERDGQ